MPQGGAGGRRNKSYGERRLELCISDIQNKKLTQREASQKYNIPRSSIILKLKAIKPGRVRPPGRQCIFTNEEETAFCNYAIEMGRYGFPITLFDLRCIVKAYLDKQGRTVPQFKNNLPGRTWASDFLKRQILNACKEHDIRFVALPPNSTHLTQPLDVAYFRPFKEHWRFILNDWKSTTEGQKLPTIPKSKFPLLLAKLWEKTIPRTEQNLKSGFLKTGIYPLDAEPLLKRLPTYRPSLPGDKPDKLVSDSFIEFIQNKRNEVVGTGSRGRKRKLNIPAGKSISAEEVQAISLPSTSTAGEKQNRTKKHSKKVEESSSTDTEEEDIPVNFDSSSDGPFEEEETEEDVFNERFSHDNPVQLEVDDFVVVEYEGESWPGQIQAKELDGAYVKCLARCGLSWKWPEKDDVIFYPFDKIKYKIKEPKRLSSKRALYQVPELEYTWGKPKK